MKNLGVETRRIGLSLLGRGAWRFLSLHQRILRYHHLCRSSPLITNMNLSPVLQRPVCFSSQMPSITRPPLCTVPIRVRCLACFITLFAAYTQRTREEVLKGRRSSRPHPEGRIEFVNMAGRYSFSDGEGPARNSRSATPSDMSSVDGRYHHVLEPTSPLPTHPSVSDDAFCASNDGFGVYDDHTCNTYERCRDAAASYRECQEVGHEETERNKLNAFRGYCF